jgi:hypothetical protein
MDLQYAHSEASLTQCRHKHVFGEVDEAPSHVPEPMVPSDEDPEFHNIAMQLIQDAEDADIPDINNLPLSSIPLIQPPIPQAKTTLLAKIPLQLLFDYSTTSLYAEEDESGGVVKSETNT